MDVLTKTYPTIPLSGDSELVRRYLYIVTWENYASAGVKLSFSHSFLLVHIALNIWDLFKLFFLYYSIICVMKYLMYE